ncbi:hypothetical protein JW899_04490 [Candidatus Uhrbacteria bacterium]|nr:hypothetical protein [Candidatus Uhrbacteria bacterium]
MHNPKEAYFVRELTRRVGAQINAVRTELKNLQDMELVVEVDDPESEGLSFDGDGAKTGKERPKRQSSGQRKYFRLNADSLVYPELLALFTKSRVLMEKDFVRRLASVGSISYLVLTGTFTGEKESPTDMLIVGRVKRERLAPMIRSFEKEIGKEVNYTVMTPQEFRYRKDVTDRFLYSILESKKLTVIDTISEVSG